MKKLITQVICTLVSITAVSAFGAVVGVWANDKLQDSKIDTLLASVSEMRVQLQNITSYLIKDAK